MKKNKKNWLIAIWLLLNMTIALPAFSDPAPPVPPPPPGGGHGQTGNQTPGEAPLDSHKTSTIAILILGGLVYGGYKYYVQKRAKKKEQDDIVSITQETSAL